MSGSIYDSAATIAASIRARERTCLEIVEACLARIAAFNSRVNAVVNLDAKRARACAQSIDERVRMGARLGALAGVPLTVKDLYEVQGLPSTSGTTGRADFRPDHDATVIERLRAAGAIVIGKTNVPEFGVSLETTNLLFGTTNNPFDLARTPGGSSGGSAASLAAGFAALDIGSDGGGSIRLPAHFCGVAGLKPTSYRVSKAGHFPAHTGIATRMGGLGPMARRIADLKEVLPVIFGEDVRDPDALPAGIDIDSSKPLSSLRVAFYTDNGIHAVTAETASMVERSAAILADAGAAVTRACLPDFAEAFEIHLALLIADRKLISEWQNSAKTTVLHPWVEAGIAYLDEAAGAFDSNSPTLIHDDWHAYRAEALKFMGAYDIVLSPVAPGPALPHGELSRGENFEWTSYACIYNVTGWPAAVVRCGTSAEGLPLGLQVAAKPFRDHLVLEVADFLEAAFGAFLAPPGFD